MRVFAFVLLALFSHAVVAAVFTVNSTNDNPDQVPGDGFCADFFGQCTLRAALQETNQLAGADVVFVPRSTSFQNAFSEQLITDSLVLSIDNPAVPAQSIFELPQIIGALDDRVFKVTGAGEVTFFGLLIRDGDASQNSIGDQGGGGVLVVDVNSFSLLNSVVFSNRAITGGGLEFQNVGAVVVNLSDVSFNEVLDPPSDGVAIKISGVNMGEARITHSSIHHNSQASLSGQCLHAIAKDEQSETLYIFNTTISNNGNTQDPLDCVGGVRTASSSLFGSSDLFLVNATIIENSGIGLGFSDVGPVITGNLLVRNTIIADNQLDCAGSMTGILNLGDPNGGHNIVSDSSCSLPAISGNLENTDPMLSSARSIFPIVDYLFIYYEPMLGSPAIDKGSPLPVNVGNPNACQQFDQLLRLRPVDGDNNGSPICDIGAVEVADLIFADRFD